MTLEDAIAEDATAREAKRSFRDPAGYLFRRDGRILRAVREPADLVFFLQTKTARAAMETGELVQTAPIDASEFPDLEPDIEFVVEHEPIPFAAYPYEWAPEMLYSAAVLTLAMAQHALEDGFGLKDATPYNVLFRGPEPVFVDVLSFERRDPLNCTWMAYGQFVRTFLLPLLAYRHFGLSLDRSLSGQRDGLEPETLYRWSGILKRLSPPFLGLVSIPKWLGSAKEASSYAPKRSGSPEEAGFVLTGLLQSCQRQLRSLEPRTGQSKWSGYHEHKSLYTPEQIAIKEAFVSDALARARPRTVLDVGANEGHFSFLAARNGSSVVAIDSDPAVVGSIWRTASRERLDVLPLVVDLTRPTPAIGWKNEECDSFLARARAGFDLVLMLAVMHHILVTERIPLEDLLGLIEEISREYVLIEYVEPEDPMFQRIVRGREGLYQEMTKTWFETAAARRFDLVRSTQIGGLHRWLYLFRLRGAKS